MMAIRSLPFWLAQLVCTGTLHICLVLSLHMLAARRSILVAVSIRLSMSLKMRAAGRSPGAGQSIRYALPL